MLTGNKILIVDDDELTREVLSSYFENEGYDVLCASTAEQAEELLSIGSVDLILLDIRMPGKDGLTLTRELRINNEVGIKQGFMTTIHSYTGDQPTLDTMHSDMYRARAAAGNMIPTSTGAAKAVGLVLPELNGKLDGVSMRVPTQNVSVVDFKFNATRPTSVEEINDIVKKASLGNLKNILGYTDEPLVSSDFNHDSHSSVFHMDQTKVMDGSFVRVLSWYDNEWGFSNRMSDTAVAISKTI